MSNFILEFRLLKLGCTSESGPMSVAVLIFLVVIKQLYVTMLCLKSLNSAGTARNSETSQNVYEVTVFYSFTYVACNAVYFL